MTLLVIFGELILKALRHKAALMIIGARVTAMLGLQLRQSFKNVVTVTIVLII